MSGKKEYVKLWLSYKTYFEPYTPEQIGNLVLAMLAYKDTGEEPEFYGPERFIWPAVKRDIDEAQLAQDAAAQQARENGKKGGRPRKESSDVPSENPFVNPFGAPVENPPGFSETQETAWTKDMDKRQGQGQGRVWEGWGDSLTGPTETRPGSQYPPDPPEMVRQDLDRMDRFLLQLRAEAREAAGREED